jgi:hypothetical protein
MSLEEFKKLIERPDWIRSQDYEEIERYDLDRGEYDPIREAQIPTYKTAIWGYIRQTSELEGITITYIARYSWIDGEKDSFKVEPDEVEPWKIEGVQVVHDDGDPMTAEELAAYLPDIFSGLEISELEQKAKG